MPAPRPFALIRTRDQWLRASHNNTALEGEVVQLYWTDDKSQGSSAKEDFTELGGGLAFDEYCRLYHSIPEEGRVERLHWALHDPLKPASDQKAPVDLFETEVDDEFGDFVLSGEQPAQLLGPAGLAVDDDGRLFVAESDAKRILVYDLRSNRLLRRVQLPAMPVDLVASGSTVYALLTSPSGLIKLTARTDPQTLELPPEIIGPSRLAITPEGELFVLEQAGTADARVVQYRGAREIVKAPFATDIEFQTALPC
ncbi:MAG TPA: hypothetical protein VFB70_15805, partial [Pyrinomonadaceae bacterium]|nr:hypothetical protein [Pyrinomonadaceae bacterium]